MRSSHLESEEARILYQGTPVAFVANALAAGTLAFIQSSVIEPRTLLTWIGLVGSAILLRIVLYIWWRTQETLNTNRPRALIMWFRIGIVASGAAWGCAAVMLFPSNDLSHQAMLTFVLSGISAGGMASLSVDTPTAYGFLLAILLPLIAMFIIEGGEMQFAMAAMALLFLVFLLSSSSRIGKDIRENIRLRLDAKERESSLELLAFELKHAKELAETGSRSKSEFLASMSHELRTPLNAILGFSYLIRIDSELPDKTRNNAYEIEHAGKHMLELVNGLIDLARIEAGRLNLTMEIVSLKTAMAESIAIVRHLSDKNGIHIIEQLDVSDEVKVLADYVKLRQTLINLLSNAVKYNRPQGYVKLSQAINGGKVRINVEDSGQGIPLHMQDRIFNSFDRLGKEQGSVEGVGIGLAITRRIIEAMGGKIGYESMEGEGSTFWVEFSIHETTWKTGLPADSLSPQ